MPAGIGWAIAPTLPDAGQGMRANVARRMRGTIRGRAVMNADIKRWRMLKTRYALDEVRDRKDSAPTS